jgi:cytochrome c553
MKSTLLILGTAALLGLVGVTHAGGNAQAGKSKAASCAGCHGPGGEGIAPNPALAGAKESEFVQAMKDYKSGKRANPVMKAFAGQVNDQDIADLAAYYASLKKK